MTIRSPQARPSRRMAIARVSAFLSLTLITCVAAIAEIPRDPSTYYPATAFDLGDLPAYVPEREVSGTIRIWGSGYIAAGNTMRFWEEGFRRHHPDVRFEYRLGESLNAVPAVYTGAADLGAGPRISWNDLKAFNHTLGYDPVQVMIMTGSYNVPGWNPAFVIVVNKANPIARLSMRQLDDVFGRGRDGGWVGINWQPALSRSDRANIRRWGQLGVRGPWRLRPIHVYGVNLRYGVSGTFANQVLRGSDAWNEQIKLFTNRPDKTKPDNTYLAVQQVADAVARDPMGIGFTGVAFASDTKVLAIGADDHGPFVTPTLATVRDRSYPLSDESYMFLNRAPGRPIDPKVREFLRYILSREGQASVVRDGKYLPLTAERLKLERAKLDK